MPDGTRFIITTDAGSVNDMHLPEVVSGSGDSRADTTFCLVSDDDRFGLVGTYDEILDLAALIISRMMSWTLVAGHSDWLSIPEQLPGRGTDNGN